MLGPLPGSRPGWPAWGSGKLITKGLVAAGDFDLVSMAEVGKLMGGDASGHVSRWAVGAASLTSALTGTQIHADMVS
jgi:hypothetical protein